MKTFFTIAAFLLGAVSFAQSGRYSLGLPLGNDIEKAFVKDYTTYQLTGGVYRDTNYNAIFWIAKMDDETVVWSTSFPAPYAWAPMDINPLDIVECNANGDILFIARNLNIDYGYSMKLIKLSASGNLLWSKELVSHPNEYSQGIYQNNPVIIENDGIIISMSGENNLVVTKINDAGNLVYSKQIKVEGSAGGSSPGYLFIPNQSGGYFAGFEHGNSAAVVSLDASINPVWAKRFPTGEFSSLRSICQTSNGKLYIGGMGESYHEVFIAELNSAGNIQNYRQFMNDTIYSVDQLLEINDSTLLANTRLGYAFIHTDDWSYDEMYLTAAFCSFRKSPNGWTMSPPWGTEYFLNFDLVSPECIDHQILGNHATTSFSITPETLTCTVSNQGNFVPYDVQLVNLPLTLTNDCFLSVAEQMVDDLTIYPNPVQSGNILSFSGELKDATIFITDLQGKTITETDFAKQIILPELTAGIYLVNIADKKGWVTTKRMVVE